MSDRIGYIYWFFVLITISFGGATGVFVTLKNRNAMDTVCRSKLDFYTANYMDRLSLASSSSSSPIVFDAQMDPSHSARLSANDYDADPVSSGHDNTDWSNNPLHVQVAQIEDDLR